MPTYSWVVEFDNVRHVVRLEEPRFGIGRSCLFFDQELVGERPFRSGWSLQFEFERGGHQFATKFVSLSTDQVRLYVDGLQVKHNIITVIPPRSTDTSKSKPSNASVTEAESGSDDSDAPISSSGSELVSEDNVHENTEVIATEEYPLDNRAGAESVTIEHEISRTVSNEMSVGSSTQKDSGISIEVLNLIKGDLSAKLIKQTGQTLGETVTRRHSIRFSAAPHQAVTYVVVWKRRVRTGNYLVLSNGTYTTIPYTAYFDLTFEVQSR